MSPEQHAKLVDYDPPPVEVHVNDLLDKRERTLIYGYDVDRRTWHVYLKDGYIWKVIYTTEWDGKQRNVHVQQVRQYRRVLGPQKLVPNKRIYPTPSDYEFCMLLKDRGCHLTFTNYEHTEPKQFHGHVAEKEHVA